MTINELLEEKGMSRYSLSKASGIPWATLSDICSGKTNLTRCNAQTLQKLSGALGMTIEAILALKVEPSESQKNGKSCDCSYLEMNLLPTSKRQSMIMCRVKKIRCLIWTVCGESCMALSMQTSGRVSFQRNRQII